MTGDIESKVAEKMAGMEREFGQVFTDASDSSGTRVTLDRFYRDIRLVSLEPFPGQDDCQLFTDWDDDQGTDLIHVWALDHNGDRVSRKLRYHVRGEVA